MRRGSRGSTTAFVLLMLPTLLVLVGLAVDLALFSRHLLLLESATDAAARAATDAYDRYLWESAGTITIDPAQARLLAEDYLKRNMPGARLVEASVPDLAPHQVVVRAEAQVQFAFVKIVGIKETTVTAVATGKKVADPK